MKFFLLFLMSATSVAFAADSVAPTSQTEYCARARSGDAFKALLSEDENLLAFTNKGGLANGGVCWWHSRFTRSANYLAVFRPELPRPTHAQALQIIETIVDNRGVVEIPGYANLREFSRSWNREIQHRLEVWQREEGFLKFGWIKGLKGRASLKPQAMKRQMDFLYEEVMTRKRVSWVKMQMKGIVAHAWLIVNMIRNSSGGYAIDYIDSAYGIPMRASYRVGDTTVDGGVPYLGQANDFWLIAGAIQRYCGDPNLHPDFLN